MGAATVIANGRGLPVGGTQNQVTSTTANVGPNALLASGSYPLPTAAGPGPLTSATATFTGGFWRVNSTPGSGQNNLVSLWTSPTAAYTYNNSPSNLGGIVPAGGLTIDGYPVVAGTYVYQFMELSAGGVGNFLLQAGGAPVMFRGCRLRAVASSPGFFNSQSGGYTGQFYAHFCDFGGAGSGSECDIAVQIAQNGGLRLLRNYISWVGSGIIQTGTTPAVFFDVIENLIENMTLYNGSLHLNGIKLQGGNANGRVLRNCVVFDQHDALGNQITQTDPIGMIPTDGTFLGQGTNPDGSSGYVVQGNFTGGGGYCYYLGSDSGNSPVSNLAFTNNQVTAGQFATGGANGTTTFAPPSGWGASGNRQSGNTWADGPSAGQSYL